MKKQRDTVSIKYFNFNNIRSVIVTVWDIVISTNQSDWLVLPARHSSSGFFASLLLKELLSAYCPVMLIFGNMAPVWTYSLFKIILPTSFWTTPRLLVVSWAPLCHMFGPPVVFHPWDMPCPLVLVGANLVDNINDTCLQVDPAYTFSVMQCFVPSLFIPLCIVLWPFSAVVFCSGTMFHSHTWLLGVCIHCALLFSTSVVFFCFT